MSNTYTGTGGASGLEVRTFDLATDLFGIDIIEVSNGTLVVGASPNIARITTGGGGGGGGTVTSVGLTAPAAFTIGGSPVTGAGTLTITGAGTVAQYIDGTGALQTTPTGTVTSVALTETGSALTITGSPITAGGTINIAGAGTNTQVILGDLSLATLTTGTVTSVALTETGTALTITGSPITAGGTFNIAGAGTAAQVILGDLSLGTLTTGTIEGTIAANQVAFGTAADTIGGDAGFTWNNVVGSKRLTLSDTSTGTMFEITSTDTGAGSAPDMVMQKLSTAPLSGDDLGVIVFKGNDATIPNPADAGYPGVTSITEFARISSEANNITAGAVNGQLDFRVQNAGALGNQMRITEGGVFVNIANDTTTDFRVDTANFNDALFVDASADNIRLGVPILNEATIQNDGTGATASPILKLYRNSSSPAANDLVGQVLFEGEELVSGDRVSYAALTGSIADATENAFDGEVEIQVARQGTLFTYANIGAINGGVRASHFNPTSADTDFIISSTGQVDAFRLDASADHIDMAVPLIITTNSAADPQLQIISTDAANTAAPDIYFYRNTATPAALDALANIFFRGNNITFAITTVGADYVAGAATTTGGGDGNMTVVLTVNGAGGITGITINNPGAGYVAGDVITVANNGGGGAGGTFTLAVGGAVTYGDIVAEIGNPFDNSEDGFVNHRVTVNGTVTNMIRLRGDGTGGSVVVGDSGNGVDFRVETDNNNSAFTIDASADLIVTNVENNFRIQDAATNTAIVPLQLRRQTTATPALGIGVGMEWVVETAASNYEIGSTVECKWASGGVAAESFTMDWRMMNGGTLPATPVMQLSSDGTLTTAKALVALSGGIQALNPISGNMQSAGNSSQIQGMLTQAGPNLGDILDAGLPGAQSFLSGNTYTIGAAAFDPAVPDNIGFTFNFVPLVATTVTIGGACDGVIAGGGTSPTGFTVPAFEPFTLSIIGNLSIATTGFAAAVMVYGNTTPI